MTTRIRLFSALLLLLPLALTACDTVEDGEDHPEPLGVQLLVAEDVAYQVFNADQITCDEAPCGLDVVVGTETLVIVHFLDSEGNVIPDAAIDDDASLRLTMGDGQVASAEVVGGSGFRFRLGGVGVGTTTLVLELMHGDHADFTTPPPSTGDAIPIRVAELTKG